MRKIILALTIVILAASFAAADTIYLKDGRTIRGTVLGFTNGRFVVRVEPRYATQSATTESNIARSRNNVGEIQYFRPQEVDHIEIDGRTLDDARFESRSVQVTLDSNWTDSGVDLRRGEKVQTSASGVITTGRVRISPDGLRSTDPTSPLPLAAEGELIGAIGDDPRAPILELGANREFVADRDGRLYLTANRNRTAQDVTIQVPGTSRGTDTGIDVRVGDPITISATGTVVAGRRIGEVGPEGGRNTGFGSVVSSRPVPTAGPGALIAYIRMSNGQLSQPYLIGSQLSTSVPVDGRLILAINDDDYSDNSGSFSVRIRY